MIFVLQGKTLHNETLGNVGSVEAVLPMSIYLPLTRQYHVTQGQASWKYRQALCDRLLIFMQKSKTTKPLHLSIFVL